jgi:hypothetical protein
MSGAAAAGDAAATLADAGRWSALVLHADDDVAVALRDLAAGEAVVVNDGGVLATLTLRDATPLGHKFALHPIGAGAAIRKYGERIGTASSDIAAGAHVHVHNLASARARTTR